MNIEQYYNNHDVRRRIIEFLGGKSLQEVSAFFITQCDAHIAQPGTEFRDPSELDTLLSRGLDVSRSLWDRESLIAHLDIEYVNFDFPAEAYLDPVRTFNLQKPAERAVEKVLLQFGVSSLHVLSGRGHHFIWRLKRNSAAFGKLSAIGRLPSHLELCYAEPHWPVLRNIDRDLGAAYSGIGLIMEYIASLVKAQAGSEASIPVELTAIEVPPQQRGREMISIDISEYGDQLHTRAVRIPYTLYLKPWCRFGILTDEIRDRIPAIVSVPLFEIETEEGIELMRDLRRAAELASRASIQIPDQSEQILELIGAYEKSELATFHNWYYSKEHKNSDLWPLTYDQVPTDRLPPCTRFILGNPNELLLKPCVIRHVVRTFLSLGWHPRHIAGLIRSKYERDYGWGTEWYFYDAATRADFYTRIFSGLITCGKDDLLTFDCSSFQQSGYCFDQQNGCNLKPFKRSLLERIKYERLADRPLNRLFLPDKHL